MFKKSGFISAIPYIALLLGLFGFAYVTFGSFESIPWKEFWSGLSKTVLAGGVFAILLKSYQFMGVFKEELSKVVYDTKFLGNRKDLEEVWGGVSKVLFKNKFPTISKEIMHDISHIYFPTDHVLYYDNYRQILEIELVDEANQIVNVKQHSFFRVFPKSPSAAIQHKTTNTLKFNTDPTEVSLKVEKFNINGVPVNPTVTEETVDKNKLKTSYQVELKGEEYYDFETCIEKRYSLLYDNAIGTVKDYIIHDFSLKLHLKGGIKVDFFDVGTLKKFKIVGVVNEHYAEYEYKGILYPKQGYLLIIKKVAKFIK